MSAILAIPAWRAAAFRIGLLMTTILAIPAWRAAAFRIGLLLTLMSELSQMADPWLAALT